jgi:hypothetical protein
MNWKTTAWAWACAWFAVANAEAQGIVLPPAGAYVQYFDAYSPGEPGLLPQGWYYEADGALGTVLAPYDSLLPGAYHFAQNDTLGMTVRTGVGFVGSTDAFNPARLILVMQDALGRTNFRVRFRLSNLTGDTLTSFAFSYSFDGETFFSTPAVLTAGAATFDLPLDEFSDRPGPLYLIWTYETQADTGDAMALDSLILSFDALAPTFSVQIVGPATFCENQSASFSANVDAEYDSLLWFFHGDTLARNVGEVEIVQAGVLSVKVWVGDVWVETATTITTLAAPDGAAILPGSQFQGTPGENFDSICPNRTAQYRLQTPPGYTGTQFNQRWNFNYTLIDDAGQPFSGNVQVTNPAPNGDAFLRFTPSDALLGRVLTLTVVYRDLLTGCSHTATRLLSVNGPLLPAVDLNAEVCVGVPITVDPQVSAAAYLWSTGANTPTLTITLPGNYWLRLTDENGCVSRTDFVVTLRNPPPVNLGPDVNACQSHTLDAGPAASYLWSTGATTRQITVTATGAYHVRIKDETGCEGRDTVLVVVSQPPVNALPPTAGFCPGEAVVLSTGNTQDPHFWSTGATTPTLTVATPGTYTVRVVRGGCEVVKSVEVSLYDPVVVNLGGNITACKSVTLDAGNVGAASYLWNTGAQTRIITVTQPGIYSVTVVNAQGCSATGNVGVNFIPEINVNLFGPDTAETGQFVDFYAVVTGGNPDFWFWDFGDGRLSNLADSSYGFYRNPGVYEVSVVAGRDFCRDTAVRTLVVVGEPVSVAAPPAAFEVRLYPNPAPQGRANLRLSRPATGVFTLLCVNTEGKIVWEKKATASELYDGVEIGDLRPGLYGVRTIHESGAFYVAKLIMVE